MSGSIDLQSRLEEIWRGLWIENQLDDAERWFTEDYVRHSGEGDHTRHDFIDTLRALRAGFSDLDFTIQDTLADGERVAWRWASVGTHDGPYLGVPATGSHVKTSGIVISRFEGERIAEEWASWNKVAVLHALGIIPLDRV